MQPKDFSTNVLIPAIVWLVCSVLITVGIMSQVEDGRFTTLLFVVICGAIFAVPMIIYLNCRTIINDYFGGKIIFFVREDLDQWLTSVRVSSQVKIALPSKKKDRGRIGLCPKNQ